MIKVIHSVSVMNRAGQETLLMNILRNIDKNEVHFSFLCSLCIHGDYDNEIKNLNGDIFYLPPNRLKNIKYLNYIGEIYSYYIFFKNHKEFDILHLHNYHSFSSFIQILGAKSAGVKSIILHSHNSNAPHKYLHYFFKKLLSLFKIEKFACSDVAGKWMFGSNKYTIINNGIILNKFEYSLENRNKIRKDLCIGNDEYVIGHIGRFNYQKNHIFLIDIFEQILKLHQKSHLLLIGTGELETSIKEKVIIRGLQNNVHFLGVKENIAEYMSSFDILLFPSLFEGLSVVLIEAQANGVPCLISDTNSKEVLLTHTIEMYSLEKSAEEWANKCIQTIENKKRMANIPVLREKGYDIKSTAEYLLERYKLLK